jgi:hypothetical protein
MESLGSEDDLPHVAATPVPTPSAGQALASRDSPLNKLLHIARTVNDTPQTGIGTTFRIAAHCMGVKGGLLTYVSQLIWWDLASRALGQDRPCVVAAALVNDHGPRFVISVSTHDNLSSLYDAILQTLPRAIAGIPVDHVVETFCPLPGDCTPFRLHAEQQIAPYIRAVYGRAVRKTMGAIGIAHAQDRCTPTIGAGVNDSYVYFARKCLKAIKSAANADLYIQPFWYKHGQRPPREVCSPEYLIESGVEYMRDS